DLIGSDSDFPVGSWMEIDNLSFINSTDAIPNGDFEVWAQLTPIYYPTKVDVDIDLLHPTFVQSTDAADGQYALGLVTRDFDGFPEPSKATIGTAEVEGVIPTFDLNENDAILNFDYKYLADNDVAEAVVTFFQESEESLQSVFVKTIDLEPTDSYETIEFNFLDELTENVVTATKMSIEFSSSKENGNVEANSFLLLDNLKVTGALSFFLPTKHFDPYRIVAYPNPTIGRVTFNLGANRTGFYRVYNNQGYLIDFVSFDNKKNMTYDLYDLPSGQYTFRFYHQAGMRVSRVIKY
ncbi:MAG: T9SS type A sorting domain-containing protein, partial [Cryomorphaceae bacterium]